MNIQSLALSINIWMRTLLSMNTSPHLAVVLHRCVLLLAVVANVGCAATHHPTVAATLGQPAADSAHDLVSLLDVPGPVTLESVVSARWSVPRSGLINLDHPTAKAAGLVDGPADVVVAVHVIDHPTKGRFIVDTGVETMIMDPERSAIGGLVAMAMDMENTLKVEHPLAEILAAGGPLQGVFLTHLHLDHVMGLPDVPKGTPLYAGPGETTPTSFQNMLVAGTFDRLLDGQAPIQEWPFAGSEKTMGFDGFDGVVDVFGDGSVWALWVPGHTPGSTAYLVRTTTGPVLLTGDASHTHWGWDHDVEPGTFTLDADQGRESFAALRTFVAAHPSITVVTGH